MFESLHLEKATLKLRTFIIIGILFSICLTVPLYFLLQPLYIKIDSFTFLSSLILLSIAIFTILEFYNIAQLKKIVRNFEVTSFIYNLQPFELIYLEKQNLTNVVNGAVNELVDNGTIKIADNYRMELSASYNGAKKSTFHITSALIELVTTYYPRLLRKLLAKPHFTNIQNSMDAFRKYFIKSKKFAVLFYTNYITLSFLLLFSFTRIVTGILRDKPVSLIVFATILVAVASIYFLYRLTKQISTTTIPDLYKKDILPAKQINENWQWEFFLNGNDVLNPSFVHLVNYIEKNNSHEGEGNFCGTSCGSACSSNSCGSSCSSCGGCGGDD